jgi:signal transduction histidine kinase
MAISLQTRLLLVVGALALSAVAVVAFGARLGTRVEFDKFQNIEHSQDARIRSAIGGVVSALDRRCCDDEAVAAATAALEPGEAVFVFGKNGALVKAFGRDADLAGVTASLTGETLMISSRETSPGVASGLNIIIKGGPVGQISLPNGEAASAHIVKMRGPDVAQPAGQFLGSVDRRLLIVAATVGGLALIFTWAVARRIGRPIADLNRATKDLARGDFSRRVTSDGSDELAELARSFNHMAAELERQQTLRRNLVHDVAHELRTPLTSLRCRIETVIDGLAPDPRAAVLDANEEVAHLSQLVADLEELANAEAGELVLSISDVAIGDVVRSAVRVAGLESDGRVRFDVNDAVTARGDAIRIRQIVVNLLTNADRHTPADGRITIRARRSGTRDALIEVHNTGSALTGEEAGRVFDRFYRADPSRQRATGTSGLGLAIVKHLAEVQSGSASVRSDATGVTFSICLPSQQI